MTAPVDYQRLSNVHDPKRSIFVKHHARNVDATFADGELRTSVTPYHLAKLIYRQQLEIDESEITHIYEVIHDDLELSINDITKDVFALAESGHFDCRDDYSALSQLGLDNERNRRAMGAV